MVECRSIYIYISVVWQAHAHHIVPPNFPITGKGESVAVSLRHTTIATAAASSHPSVCHSCHPSTLVSNLYAGIHTGIYTHIIYNMRVRVSV